MIVLRSWLTALLIAGFISESGFSQNTASVSASDAARIHMLEKALAPKSPNKLASLFAKANKDRNGAVQFMLFSDALKTKYKDYWMNWVSGASSPWIRSYKINQSASKDNQWTFTITYQRATSTGPFDTLIQTLVIQPNSEEVNASQDYLITQLKEEQK